MFFLLLHTLVMNKCSWIVHYETNTRIKFRILLPDIRDGPLDLINFSHFVTCPILSLTWGILCNLSHCEIFSLKTNCCDTFFDIFKIEFFVLSRFEGRYCFVTFSQIFKVKILLSQRIIPVIFIPSLQDWSVDHRGPMSNIAVCLHLRKQHAAADTFYWKLWRS